MSREFYSSLDMLREEERFAKSPWERLLDDVADMLPKRSRLRVTSARAAKMSREFRQLFSKALAQPKPKRVVSVAVVERGPSGAEVVAKAFDALNHNQYLNAAQRGALMLGLSDLAGRVEFAFKADTGKIERALDLLKRARAAKKFDDADDLIHRLEQSIRRGEVEPSDVFALEERLHEIRRQLNEDSGHGEE